MSDRPVITWTLGRLERATELRRARRDVGRLGTGRAVPRHRRSPSCSAVLSRCGKRHGAIGLWHLVHWSCSGYPEAGGVIRRCLHSDDAEVRAQAIEALDSIGDGGCPQALVRLLEDDGDRCAGSRCRAARLVDDDDPWISAPGAAGHEAGADAMPDTSRTLGDLETMMLLRRVPLFEGLEPEDLQRIAMTSVEHLYPVDEALVREGDVGDESDRHRRGLGPGRPRRSRTGPSG